MLISSQSNGGLETLSRIINEIRPSSDFVDQLDQFTTKLNEVIPFNRCVVLHEREGKGISRGFVYRNGGALDQPYGRSGQSSCGPAIGIDDYVKRFSTTDRLDHAFRWTDRGAAMADASPRVAELVAHMRGGSGVAASVRSMMAGTDDVGTMLQFECAGVSMHQVLLVSFVAFYLHSTFTLHAVDPNLQDDFFGINLTGKERDVLKWVVEGKTSWEIGRILSTSERTVKFHLKNVYAKLNVCNRAQAVAVVNRLRLI
ncbi:MAG TPA: helix-turn-helix transcriptional regulator [Albitalea sp.]|nr:helix-turn-helix transcriptional regulator [Albitalea sp.]